MESVYIVEKLVVWDPYWGPGYETLAVFRDRARAEEYLRAEGFEKTEAQTWRRKDYDRWEWVEIKEWEVL